MYQTWTTEQLIYRDSIFIKTTCYCVVSVIVTQTDCEISQNKSSFHTIPKTPYLQLGASMLNIQHLVVWLCEELVQVLSFLFRFTVFPGYSHFKIPYKIYH